MTNEVRSRHDRHLRLAAKVTETSAVANETKFLRPVLFTGEAGELSTREGRLLALTAVNLVARFCPLIDVWFPSALGLAGDCVSLAKQIDSTPDARFAVVDACDTGSYAAVVHIGSVGPAGENVTNVLGRGWLASISSTSAAPILRSHPFTPFGPVLAACFAAAEVFKRLLSADPEKVALWGPTVFSAASYEVRQSEDAIAPAPFLEREIMLPVTLLAGAGAVGNAFAYVLSRVDGVRGELAVADKEVLGEEDDSNLNRYSLAHEAHLAARMPKAWLVAAEFRHTDVKVTPFHGDIDAYLQCVYGGAEPRPAAIVSAVDNNGIRPSLQRMWPDCLIEGATGDSLFQVSRHVYAEQLACLMCIHPAQGGSAKRSPQELASENTGLPLDVVAAGLRDGDRQLTEDDVAVASPEKQAFLRARLGHRVCSVFADAAQLSNTPGAVPAAPTVSFVSMAAGALAAAELVRYAEALPSPLETIYQMDVFVPPSVAMLVPMEKSRTCECYTRHREHDAYRALAAQADSSRGAPTR